MSADTPARRILLLSVAGRETVMIRSVLGGEGAAVEVCADLGSLVRALDVPDAGVAIVAQEALIATDTGALAQWIAAQEPWSDFPFVLVTSRSRVDHSDTEDILRLVDLLGNVTVLDQPLHRVTLVSAVRGAFRTRSRQREAKALLVGLENARLTTDKGREGLEQLVAQRTASLQREMLERENAEYALAQAQKMEAVGQLTGGVAHDFNNLLTAVMASLEIIAQRTSDARVQRFVVNAQQAAERGARLTQQLLAFSRRQRLAPEAVDINRLVTGMQDLLVRTIGATIEIGTHLGDDIPPAFVDPTQLELAVLNLAINARDAMPDGGRLAVTTELLQSVPPELRGELAEGPYVAIAVADTGTGMSPEVQAKVFEPFFTTKELGKGTGLGLSQVYGFVKQSGGTVRLQSTLGEGTTVRVYLPRGEHMPAQARPEAPKVRTVASERATVLVVDDDRDVRELVVMILEEIGYQVLAAEDGRTALSVLDSGEHCDLLLVDLVMPGLSGVDVARVARERRPEVRVLFATGYPDLHAFHEMLRDEEMIHKPYHVKDLAAGVERALHKTPRTPPA